MINFKGTVSPDVHEELKELTIKKSFSDVIQEMLDENKMLKAAFHEAINKPKGVVPDGFDGLYDAGFYDKQESEK